MDCRNYQQANQHQWRNGQFLRCFEGRDPSLRVKLLWNKKFKINLFLIFLSNKFVFRLVNEMKPGSVKKVFYL